ncbi:MAG TPA: DUF4352 domain-containing protein [Bryobacteraceae bacterium]|nr:DUF4352 domain-containing protein [Bryobacteraceae bacterium]
MRHCFCVALVSLFALTGCSSNSNVRKSATYAAGDKAEVGHLTYTVVDTDLHTKLGDDPNNPRLPQNRFYVVQISVFNGGNTEAVIPGMTLLDDAGQAYEELTDGTGVPHWLGVARRVGPGQTEQGNIVFDAPASHFKLRLTDDTDESDVFVDLPLSFAHEQMHQDTGGTYGGLPVAPPDAVPGPPAQPARKK